METEIIAAIVGALVGSIISGGAAIIGFIFIRRRTALDSFIAEVTEAIYLPYGPDYSKENTARINQAIIRLRPYLSDKCFTECLTLAESYQEGTQDFKPGTFEHRILCYLENQEPRAEAIAFSQRLISTASGATMEALPKCL